MQLYATQWADQRERDREQREDQRRRDQQQWEREDRHRFTEQKRELYARQLLTLRAFRDALRSMLVTVEFHRERGDDISDPHRLVGPEALNDSQHKAEAAAHAMYEMQIWGELRVALAITAANLDLVNVRNALLSGNDPGKARALLDQYETGDLIQRMRDDLAVDGPESQHVEAADPGGIGSE